MAFLLKIAYYGLLSISSLVGLFYFAATLYSLLEAQSSSKSRDGFIMLLATGTALGLLYKAYQIGHLQSHFGTGIGMVLAGFLAFLVIFLVGMFTFGKFNWQ